MLEAGEEEGGTDKAERAMSSPDDISQPHDGLVRYMFGQMEYAASFFRENLPAALWRRQ